MTQTAISYGDVRDGSGATRPATSTTLGYDARRRPTLMNTLRTPTGSGPGRPLSAVTRAMFETLSWDLADNLIDIEDGRIAVEWPDGYRPQSTAVTHDALYRVVGAEHSYSTDTGTSLTDLPSDWRTEALASRSNDPMRSTPAPMVDGLPSSRPMYVDWQYDWLGNMNAWNDDAGQFYERSIGDITNGFDVPSPMRPGALRMAHNLVPAAVGADHGGWLEADYGVDGNVTGLTVHANCRDDNDDTNGDVGLEICDPSTNPAHTHANRTARLRDRCISSQEQHYTYRWDELNRIAEAYRFERNNSNGTGPWTLMVRQRYLYDASNERMVKQTYDTDVVNGLPEGVALYVYPGDFERRGLARNAAGTAYDALPGAETQYVVGGARLVYRDNDRGLPPGTDPNVIDRDQRLTIGLTDIIQSTSATLDLLTGELVEVSNYYPNGARESYRGSTSGERVAPEPMGFTGKEADEEVGLVYFGQRYLLAHLGRWASPDPLQVHAVGGGEALNGYHYVAGNVLQARDPVGLDIVQEVAPAMDQRPGTDRTAMYDAAVEESFEFERQVRADFGIETVVTHAGTDPSRADRTVRISLEAIDPGVADRMGADARSRARANLVALHGADSPLVDQGMQAWEAARTRLIHDLADDDVEIVLTNRNPMYGSHGTLSSAFTYYGQIYSNPYHYESLTGTGGGERSRGVLYDYLHERDHQSGCLRGDASACLTGAEGDFEAATTADIDTVLQASGLPVRGDYAASDPGGPGGTVTFGTEGRRGSITVAPETTLRGPAPPAPAPSCTARPY